MDQEIQNLQTQESEKQEKGGAKEEDEDEEFETILELVMKIKPPKYGEEEKRKRHEELGSKITQAFQELLEKEYNSAQNRMEQERIDHELAVLFSQHPYDSTEEMSLEMKRSLSVQSIQEAQGKQNYDLTNWKYSELRDTINTSCNTELLEACKIEFHRRLKVYHAWKAKNRKWDDNQRAPSSILEEGNKPKHIPLKMPINNVTQRYFRIPFVRPTENQAARGEKRGWWYAHFDGQYVARQMELHPEKPAILLTAGSDDMQMCELSLDETGLTRKRGAEILEQEFNREWVRYGENPNIQLSDKLEIGKKQPKIHCLLL